MSETNAPNPDGTAGGWSEVNEFSLTRNGHYLTRYMVHGVAGYLLWDKAGKPHGPFDTVKAGMDHYDCIAPTDEGEGNDGTEVQDEQ
ncbi:hypothetical protein BLA23254_08052 [Burkholderia lata]|uniref:Uncharacterized protein n=1 Tax=Burkholderia lata (strain ATCC 17760 / DSM 23089 / LMG 22485 / NCIMB 9086 / R18194 / 383) TaxID=482957 RepID=A0A6P2SSK9_BURL3|nr:hypothetical protein [Burkholderia lata]VWC52674.1 hypothetical protein BLA23254_08052 [Burkholderia lata]